MEHSRRSIIDEYDKLVAQGRIERDGKQTAVVEKLDELASFLRESRLAKKASALGWLFGARRIEQPTPRGLYIWGSVGRGKTMLMDLFYETVEFDAKRRVHFHSFMADVHKRIFAWRQKKKAGQVKGDDPIGPVADELFSEATLLCFDEFSVTDITDAMILGRLFEALWARKLVVVATSNVDPADLYKDGLNRALFLPFIGEIQRNMEVVRLDSRTDFRLEKLGGDPVYYTPANVAARAALDRTFLSLAGGARGAPLALPLLGREVIAPQASGRVARFDYEDLCRKPLGATDFLAIAEYFHVVLIDNIPVINPEERNEAKRFINLIDALYDQKVKLIASADAPPERLYLADRGREAFEFARTVSRLTEMRSREYMELPHGLGDEASGDTTGLVET
ncbi:cell division protein ZapE [Rhodoblastus sp.]|uniref:cell division protein ZapE n=1 Tax=Rhodoblastus sp. TaxID=1962975 RepID=UPI00261666DD|nr:cell division protein ZapE [Rhodoblastus sp.]